MENSKVKRILYTFCIVGGIVYDIVEDTDNHIFLRTGKGYAEDYFLDAKSQCAGDRGACPDE